MEKTPAPQRTKPVTQMDKGGTLSLIVFAMLLGVVGLLLIYSDTLKDPEDQVNQTDSQNSISNSLPVSTESFSEVSTELAEVYGTYFALTMPSNWAIVEYPIETDAGVSNLSGESYTGLTAFSIYDQDDKVVFTLGGVLEREESTTCFEIYGFNDTDQEYLDSKISEAEQAGVEEPMVVTLDDYTEFSFLGERVRRVGRVLYFDADGSDSFNPECGASYLVRDYSGVLTFGVDEIESPLYLPVIHESAPEADLIHLDSVLNSLVIN